mgnify:CR=1 FL=1|jgi:hypothetical protein|tara:strand:+ start:95 stop:439 length:345 start_codon:yes stop_codon:yes gene_type:complete
MDDLTKELENVNYRADYDYEASKAYRANTHDKLDAIAKSIDALTKKLGDYHETSRDVHIALGARMYKVEKELVANGKNKWGSSWRDGAVVDYVRPGKLERFEKNDVKDPVNLKL